MNYYKRKIYDTMACYPKGKSMDSKGNFYADSEVRKRLEEMFAKQVGALSVAREQVRPMEDRPADSIDVDEGAAIELAGMNRCQRMVFYSERARKRSVEEALQTARECLPK